MKKHILALSTCVLALGISGSAFADGEVAAPTTNLVGKTMPETGTPKPATGGYSFTSKPGTLVLSAEVQQISCDLIPVFDGSNATAATPVMEFGSIDKGNTGAPHNFYLKVDHSTPNAHIGGDAAACTDAAAKGLSITWNANWNTNGLAPDNDSTATDSYMVISSLADQGNSYAVPNEPGKVSGSNNTVVYKPLKTGFQGVAYSATFHAGEQSGQYRGTLNYTVAYQ